MPRCSYLVHFLTLSSSGASGNKLPKCIIQLSSLHSHHLPSYLEPSTNRSQAPWAGLVCVDENTPSPLAVTSSSWSFWHHDSTSTFSVYISVAPLAIFYAILLQMFSGFLESQKTKTTQGQSEWAMEKLEPVSTGFNPSTSLGKENYKSFHRNTHTLDIMFYYYDNEDSYPGIEGKGSLLLFHDSS